jgi:hypothetical protein
LPVVNLASLVSVATGHDDIARRLMAAPLPVGGMSNQPYVLAKLGDTTTALRLVAAMESNTPRPWFTDAQRASIKLATGDTAGALNGLDQWARSRSSTMWIIPPLDPAYDAIRHTARFAALLRQTGLDVQTLTAPRSKRPR